MVTIGGTTCDVTSATGAEIRCDVGTGDAGDHDIILNVADKGLARHENQNHTFTYEFDVDDIDPTSGGLGGENAENCIRQDILIPRKYFTQSPVF